MCQRKCSSIFTNDGTAYRLSAAAALLHPYFWSPSKRLAFLQDASDRFEAEERDTEGEDGPSSEILPRLLQCLEQNAESIIGVDWHKRIDRGLIDDLRKFRRYQGHRIMHLLRALRNKRQHYQDLSDQLKRTVGDIPDGYLSYWTLRFPKLLLHVYHVLQSDPNVYKEPVFREYFG